MAPWKCACLEQGQQTSDLGSLPSREGENEDPSLWASAVKWGLREEWKSLD